METELSYQIPAPLETEVTGTASDLLHEEMDTSDFNRSIIQEEVGNILADDSVYDVPVETSVTYEVVEEGTTRRMVKLVSSDGYAFVKKRQLANGTVDWRCSVRPGRGSGCLATVKQKGGVFITTGRSHNHPSRPGILTSVKQTAKMKTISKMELFESASVIVKRVQDAIPDEDEPEGARTDIDNLIQICNRTRQHMRPKEPTSLEDFKIDKEFVDGLGQVFHRGTVTVKERCHIIFATDQL